MCLFTVLTFSGLFAQTPVTGTGSDAKSPEVFLQILNGIAPDPIDIELEGKVIFPSMGPGQRISAFGLLTNKVKLVLVNKKTSARKTIPVDLEKGHYTLIIAGDFQLIPEGEKGKDGELPVRVFSSILSNGPTKSEPSVRVRLVNGLADKSILVKGPAGQEWTVSPMQMEVASALPEKLLLEASTDASSRRNLYLGQDSPPKNIAVVFFSSGQTFAFRAMTEFTPEGGAADQRRASEAEKREEEEAAKVRR